MKLNQSGAPDILFLPAKTARSVRWIIRTHQGWSITNAAENPGIDLYPA